MPANSIQSHPTPPTAVCFSTRNLARRVNPKKDVSTSPSHEMSASIRLTKNNHRGPSLLKQIDGLKRSDSLESLSRKAAIDQRKSVATLETPMKDDTGSPLDSDGDSTIRNPDIKRSQFRRGNGVAEQKGEKKVLPTRVSGRIRSTAKGNGSISSCSTSSSGKRGFEGDDEEHIPRSSSHSQPSNSQGIGSQHGIFGSSQSKRPKTYGGGKAQKSFGSSQNQLGSSPEKKEPKTQFKKPLTRTVILSGTSFSI